MSFRSSVNLRRKRHKLETSARGPPSRKNIMKKIMPLQGSGERNVYIVRPMNDTSGVSSSHCDLGSKEES